MKYRFELPATPAVPIRGARELFPIRRIFCVGRNYHAHAVEMGAAVNQEGPFYFTKSALAYVPSGSTIPYPPGTANFHYEMELVAALGAPAFRVSELNALEAVFGYACGLDMTRRDLQLAARERHQPWDVGKDFEQSAVVSEIVPASEIGHPSSAHIELKVNGTVRQSSDIKRLIFPVAALISDLSKLYHLQAGDLIYTGTPEGVGPVKPGDRLEGSISGIGSIALGIAAAES